ncbi:MAG: hypothetical protein ACKO2P_05095, partial [Planctomycetota bacterium]
MPGPPQTNQPSANPPGSSSGPPPGPPLRLWATTIFLSAFLLFLVQPAIGRLILPWFGGAPAV